MKKITIVKRYSGFLFLALLITQVLQAQDMGNQVKVWAVPAERKVRPTDAVEKSNLVWSGESRTVKVAGAGNEHVPFQVVITTDVPQGWRAKAPEGFFIKSGELISETGKVIPVENITMFLEHYIQIYGRSGPMGETGLWPDALAPIRIPFSMAAQYHPVGNRPVWTDIFIPANTPGGIYKGTVDVLRFDKVIETLNVELEVYNFSLPEKTHLITYVNVSKGELARFYNKPASSPEIEELMLNYFDFLFAHRMETWFNDPLVPEVTYKDGKVGLKFNDERYSFFLNRMKTKRVILEAAPNELIRQIKADPFSAEFTKAVTSYLSQTADYFRRNGWKSALVFNSPVDEPNSKEDYEITRRWATLVHEAAPGTPFLATESPVADNAEWGTLRGYVNNFCVHGNDLNEPAVKKALTEEQQKGGEATWYISCDQIYPQPNYFIDAPALDPVMVPWITAKYHMDGILYWAANFWNQTPDPWLDPVTFISGFDCSNGYVLNGEGSLIYPGDHTKMYTGQPDVKGPVSSIRFELLRDGIEDYEYLWMLKDRGETAFAEEKVNDLVVDVSAFSRNLEELYLTRKAMARRLENTTKK